MRRQLLRVWRANIRKHGTERLDTIRPQVLSDYGVAKNIGGRCPDRYITGDICHVVVNAAVPTESVDAVPQHQRLGVGLRESAPRSLRLDARLSNIGIGQRAIGGGGGYAHFNGHSPNEPKAQIPSLRTVGKSVGWKWWIPAAGGVGLKKRNSGSLPRVLAGAACSFAARQRP